MPKDAEQKLPTTYYDTLQVARNANPAVIRASYRALSQQYHPDRNPDDLERATRSMKLINEAYEVLSDPVRRVLYDAGIAATDAAAGSPSEGFSPRANEFPDRECTSMPNTGPAPPSPQASTVASSQERSIQIEPGSKRGVWLVLVLLAVGATWLLVQTQKQRPEPVVVLAGHGDVPSQIKMGWASLVPPDGGRRDFDSAVAWFRKAAEKGSAEAQLQLAELLLSTGSDRPNPAEGMKWLIEAAESGYSKAQGRLGTQYLHGHVKDIPAAISWLERAAMQGNRSAQLSLATAYEALVPPDNVNAYAWMWLASDHPIWVWNGEYAGVRKHGLVKLEERMSNAELARARVRITQLKATLGSSP